MHKIVCVERHIARIKQRQIASDPFPNATYTRSQCQNTSHIQTVHWLIPIHVICGCEIGSFSHIVHHPLIILLHHSVHNFDHHIHHALSSHNSSSFLLCLHGTLLAHSLGNGISAYFIHRYPYNKSNNVPPLSSCAAFQYSIKYPIHSVPSMANLECLCYGRCFVAFECPSIGRVSWVITSVVGVEGRHVSLLDYMNYKWITTLVPRVIHMALQSR